jgi:hypothetical protein
VLSRRSDERSIHRRTAAPACHAPLRRAA